MKFRCLLSLLCLLPLMVRAKPGQQFPPLTAKETAAIAAAIPDSARARPGKPRKLLLFYRTEGFVHKSIPNANHAIELMGNRTGAYTVVISDDMAQFDPETLNTYDAVVFNNTSQLKFENPAHRQAFLDFVRRGKGVIGIHAGSDNFPTWPEGQALMGGVFHSHPWGAKDTVAVKNDDPDHILNAAFEKRGFWITEEIYQIVGPYSRETQRILLSLDMNRAENARSAKKIVRNDNDFAISWLKTEGKGRVFYTSLGHNKDIFEVPQILRHLLDGIQYALGDLAADAVPSARLKTQPVPAFASDDKTTLQALAASLAQASAPSLQELATYESGDPLARQLAYEKYIRTVDAGERASIAGQLETFISAPATTIAAKRIFIKWLGWIGAEKSISTLTTAAKNPGLAHAATRALAAIDASGAETALLSLTDAIRPESVRIEALNALGQRRADSAVSNIATFADDKNSAVAAAALDALAAIGTQNAIDSLRRAGGPELPRVRAALLALDNLVRRNPSAAIRAQVIGLHAETLASARDATARVEAARALLALDPANPALLPPATDSDARLRNVIAVGMAVSGNSDAVAMLASRFNDIPADTRRRMMVALASTRNATAMPLIGNALDGADESLRLAALSAAGACGDENTVATLLPWLARKEKDVSAAAFNALARLPDCDGKTNAALRRQLDDAAMKPKVMLVLAQRQDRSIYSVALADTETGDNVLRAAAYEAIALLVRPGDLPQVAPLAGKLQRPVERREWIKALYIATAAHPDAKAAVELLQRQLDTAKPVDLPSFIAALTMVNSRDAKTALSAMLASSDIEARKETIRALSSARTQTAYDLLVDHIAVATDTSERLLTQRGAIDTLNQLSMSKDKKVAAYRKLWQTADTQENKDAIIAAVKRIRHDEATKFLKEFAPAE